MAEEEVKIGVAAAVVAEASVGDAKGSGSDSRRPRQSNQRPLARSAQVGATAPANLYLDLGTPSAGLLWDVRQVAVMAGDPFTASAGTAVAVVVAGEVSSYQLGQVLSTGAQGATANEVPWTFSFSRHTRYLRTPDHLGVVIHAPVANTSYTCTAQVIEEEDRIAWPGT